jgi:hypothetical protein
MLLFKKLAAVLLLIITFSACQNQKCQPAPDVSAIKAEAKFERFEQDLFGIDTSDMATGVEQLRSKYPFFDFYVEVLGLKEQGKPDDARFYHQLKGFISFPAIQASYDTVQTVFGDISDIEVELTQAFKYFKHYLPSYDLPKLYTIYSEYSYGVIMPPDSISTIMLGLEMFFGVDYDIYYAPQIDIPKYISRTMNKDHITAKIMYAILDDIIRVDDKSSTLLDYMVKNGKLLYILDKTLPCTSDSVKLGYSNAQTQWVKGNEIQMWREIFVSKLYETSYKDFQKFISLSPNSPNMPSEAPGNTGSYVGWKIVNAFMERNPNYSVEQLLKMDDSQKILQMSRYKPR